MILSVLFLLTHPVWAEDYLLCRRDPTIYPVSTESVSSDGCSGGAKLQGIAYKCGKMAETENLSRDYLNELVVSGRKECSDLCNERGGKSCVGVFTAPEKCAISTTPQKAQEFGRNLAKCGPHCEGQTFIYCSLYHASFLRTEPDLFKKHTPNCYCRKLGTK